ncbi:hypothetical protein GX51_05186 [Blastomyces parvus]|uniref:G-patch domain-containing protein n=1 Tax=Blastomyces parvus TaxID=2060905 RepID=A0A2B7WY20_9EURO|nr:hypothetical protein GX51_05186 [Blastomyces parvus]
MTYDDDEYFLPLEDQRVFGAGIKRKRVPFIPSSETAGNTISSSTSSTPNKSSIGDKYLSIVLSSTVDTEKSEPYRAASAPTSMTTGTTPTCEICNLPLSPSPSSSSNNNAKYTPNPHEATLAHQVCLPHSHPPSAIDRTRPGFKYLSAQGWDPDSRLGLGPQGHGISIPLKPKIKRDTFGLGVKSPKPGQEKAKTKVEPLNAKQVRKLEAEGKKKGERLREMFYAREDFEKYLGT